MSRRICRYLFQAHATTPEFPNYVLNIHKHHFSEIGRCYAGMEQIPVAMHQSNQAPLPGLG